MRFDPATFVDDCTRAGFTPARAMMLYDEIRTFCGPEVVGLPNPKLKDWQELKAIVRGMLEGVDTPEDFEAYRKSWSQPPLKPWLDGFMERETLQEDFDILQAFIPRADFIHRMSGMMGASLKEEWQAWEDVGMEWEDVQAAMDSDRMVLARTDVPDGLTHTQARQALEVAVGQAGLASLTWPAAQGEDATTLWALAQDVNRCRLELTSQTGWPDQSMGMGGRITLNLGQDRSGMAGLCSNEGADLQIIETSATHQWGPYAHEWMHAVDHILHARNTQTAKVASEAKKAWTSLHNGLDQSAWKEKDRQAMAEAMTQVVLNGWQERPATKAVIAHLVEHPEADDKKAFSALVAAVQQDDAANPAHLEVAEPRAAMALTEVNMLRDALSSKEAVWTAFGKRFSEAATAHMAPEVAEGWNDYFLLACERASHSFEAIFPANSRVSDVQPNHSFRYPLGPEVAQHQLVWKRFFRATKDWAQSLIPQAGPEPVTAAVPASLAEARARRNAGAKSTENDAHGPTLGAALPQAARP